MTAARQLITFGRSEFMCTYTLDVYTGNIKTFQAIELDPDMNEVGDIWKLSDFTDNEQAEIRKQLNIQ